MDWRASRTVWAQLVIAKTHRVLRKEMTVSEAGQRQAEKAGMEAGEPQ